LPNIPTRRRPEERDRRSEEEAMAVDLSKIGILTRREIEARIAGPLIKAFMAEIGEERALEIARKVIVSLARESGETLHRLAGGNSLEDFARGLPLWSRDDAVTFDLLEATPEKLSMNVTRCRYAEMYRELGMADLGFILSCARDFAMVEGFNPKMNLERTQTIMEGADHCDFRFSLPED
jgi:predicted hydrocarbon binding protein